MIDLTVKPTLNAPRPRRDRLGWWHEICRRMLLVGHDAPEIPQPLFDAPEPVRGLLLQLEDHRSQFAEGARAFGGDYKGGYWMMYLFAPLAVLFAAAAWSAPEFSAPLAGAELVVIVMILVLFLIMRRARWQELWVRTRRTAEHLRYLPLVAPFVRDPKVNWYQDVAGAHGTRIVIDDEVTRVCVWLAHTNAAHALRLDDAAHYLGFVRYVDATLTQQIQYHAEKAAAERALARRISLASTAFFVITIICTALLFLAHWTEAIGLDHVLAPQFLRMAATVLPAIGAGLRGLLAQGESHRVAALSAGMSVRLTQLREQLRALAQTPSSRATLEDIVWNSTQELLSEADTWMRLQEAVPLTVAG